VQGVRKRVDEWDVLVEKGGVEVKVVWDLSVDGFRLRVLEVYSECARRSRDGGSYFVFVR
jgi:hypothetical protein